MFLLRRFLNAFLLTHARGSARNARISFALAAMVAGLALVAPRPARAQGTPIVQNNFEDGTLQGWVPRGGSVVLANTTEAAHTGTHSLKTTGRTAGFNGPALDVTTLLVKGATYQVTCWVRLVPGEAATQLKVTVQRTVSGANSFDSVAQSSATGVTDAAWVQLTGLYAFGGGDPLCCCTSSLPALSRICHRSSSLWRTSS